jgi:hypothetical protein
MRQTPFVDEGRFLPPVARISDALKFREDPYLRAIREHLKQLHNGLIGADQDAISEARREIQKARRKLERRAGWDKALRWLAYFAVPASIAEPLLSPLPILSLTLTIISAVGAAASHRTEKQNQWVLFGS